MTAEMAMMWDCVVDQHVKTCARESRQGLGNSFGCGSGHNNGYGFGEGYGCGDGNGYGSGGGDGDAIGYGNSLGEGDGAWRRRQIITLLEPRQ